MHNASLGSGLQCTSGWIQSASACMAEMRDAVIAACS
ncbi:hypothetical protein XVE_5071 [Xanthomonas vesicatoria ATCC 35937]|uniref:Uncharacterized protein n=1 Tax=Xanthomonas vesicatoria ATCC 35937 TaxID=925775 RepID=F0BL97_9XANT|nr:hypothetical protein XVE_5071 [Xanthomonas vesicatoria ATCC 35937]